MPRSIPLRPAPLALSLSLLASFSAPALAADPVEQQMVVIGSRAPTSISELPGTVWVIEIVPGNELVSTATCVAVNAPI